MRQGRDQQHRREQLAQIAHASGLDRKPGIEPDRHPLVVALESDRRCPAPPGKGIEPGASIQIVDVEVLEMARTEPHRAGGHEMDPAPAVIPDLERLLEHHLGLVVLAAAAQDQRLIGQARRQPGIAAPEALPRDRQRLRPQT
jgi:hypothetical protein